MTVTKPALAERLLNWYAAAARALPWRGSPDPYAVWVSEIMLQQTRVEAVIPYFTRWMERFPSLAVLAAASEQDVLAAWEGLGYYSRARNLWKAARQVQAEHGGNIPATAAGLRSLPGVGAYTAAAIASIAFGQDEAALDGNFRRVLARVFNVTLPARSTKGEARLWELAREHLPAGRAGDYNQALMDLGAGICKPQNPTCLLCPLAEFCEALALGVQEERPVMETRAPIPTWTVTAAILQRDGLVLVARRPSHGLLGGMWEFPGGKVEEGEELPAGLQREIREELGVEIRVGQPFGIYRHAYTHFKVVLHAFLCTLADGEPDARVASEIRWVQPGELAGLPMGKIDRQIAGKLADNP